MLIGRLVDIHEIALSIKSASNAYENSTNSVSCWVRIRNLLLDGS
jgi:hypothetical protein